MFTSCDTINSKGIVKAMYMRCKLSTFLLLTSYSSQVQLLVNTLLQRGANPSASDRKLRTPLHFAVKKNFRGVASKLLENDALPHARDKEGVLPLKIAMDNANDEIAALLLTYMSNWV